MARSAAAGGGVVVGVVGGGGALSGYRRWRCHLWRRVQAVNLPTFYAARGLSEVDGYAGVFISVAAEIPGVALGSVVVDRVGRRRTLGAAMAGCGLALLVFSQV